MRGSRALCSVYSTDISYYRTSIHTTDTGLAPLAQSYVAGRAPSQLTQPTLSGKPERYTAPVLCELRVTTHHIREGVMHPLSIHKSPSIIS